MDLLFGEFLVRMNCIRMNQLVITVHTFTCLHFRHIISETSGRFGNCFKILIMIPTGICSFYSRALTFVSKTTQQLFILHLFTAYVLVLCENVFFCGDRII
jgi:hypothetical protein